jgi:tripartite-type tricarboxylate transporter receptor subunit TctC
VVPNQFTRLYFVGPGVPADRAAALTAAFAQTIADPEFLAEAERGKLDIVPVAGAEVQRLIAEYLTVPTDLKAKLEKILPAQ